MSTGVDAFMKQKNKDDRRLKERPDVARRMKRADLVATGALLRLSLIVIQNATLEQVKKQSSAGDIGHYGVLDRVAKDKTNNKFLFNRRGKAGISTLFKIVRISQRLEQQCETFANLSSVHLASLVLSDGLWPFISKNSKSGRGDVADFSYGILASIV